MLFWKGWWFVKLCRLIGLTSKIDENAQFINSKVFLHFSNTDFTIFLLFWRWPLDTVNINLTVMGIYLSLSCLNLLDQTSWMEFICFKGFRCEISHLDLFMGNVFIWRVCCVCVLGVLWELFGFRFSIIILDVCLPFFYPKIRIFLFATHSWVSFFGTHVFDSFKWYCSRITGCVSIGAVIYSNELFWGFCFCHGFLLSCRSL